MFRIVATAAVSPSSSLVVPELCHRLEGYLGRPVAFVLFSTLLRCQYFSPRFRAIGYPPARLDLLLSVDCFAGSACGAESR